MAFLDIFTPIVDSLAGTTVETDPTKKTQTTETGINYTAIAVGVGVLATLVILTIELT